MNDQQIVEYLRTRGQVSPPVDFTRSVMAALDSTPVQPARFSSYVPAFVAIGVAAAIAVLALLVGPGRDVGTGPSPSAPAEAATVQDLQIALMASVDVLRAAPGVEGRQQAEINGTIGTATWFDWRPNGDQVVVTRWDLDVTETGWWVVPDGSPPATGQSIYTNIQANVGDEFYFTAEAGDWEIRPRNDQILAIGTGMLDRSVLPWYPLMGLGPSFPDAPESEARVERHELPDGGVEWELEFLYASTPVDQRWTIGPGGELRSWTMEREDRSVDPEGDFVDNATRAWLQFTIAGGESIEPPDLEAVPDPAVFGLPEDFPLTPPVAEPSPTPQPVGAVQQVSCADPTLTYQVTLPEGWWTNVTVGHPVLGEQPACHFFGPTDFDVAAMTPEEFTPDGVSMTISFIDGGCIGFLTPAIESREVDIDGWAGTAAEYSSTVFETDPPGSYEIFVSLRPGTDCEIGSFIVGRTSVDMAGDYEANKALLDQVMASMEITFTAP